MWRITERPTSSNFKLHSFFLQFLIEKFEQEVEKFEQEVCAFVFDL